MNVSYLFVLPMLTCNIYMHFYDLLSLWRNDQQATPFEYKIKENNIFISISIYSNNIAEGSIILLLPSTFWIDTRLFSYSFPSLLFFYLFVLNYIYLGRLK